MANVVQTVAPPIFPGKQQPFGDWLFSGIGQGLSAYPGSLYPSMNNTILPNVSDAWHPWDPGQVALQQLLTQGMPGNLQQGIYNTNTFGGQPGWPLDLMHSMAQFGGAGQPANFMSNIMQFGGPTAGTAQPLHSIAQTGGAGSWGQMLQNFALGQNNPMAQYLTPFLGAKPYTAPQMNFGGK